MLMRVYISGGITGVENYKHYFEIAKKRIGEE